MAPLPVFLEDAGRSIHPECLHVFEPLFVGKIFALQMIETGHPIQQLSVAVTDLQPATELEVVMHTLNFPFHIQNAHSLEGFFDLEEAVALCSLVCLDELMV